MTNHFHPFLGLCLVIFLSFSVNAQTDKASLRMKSGLFEISLNSDLKADQVDFANWPKYNGKAYGLICLSEFPSSSEQTLLKERGVAILGFLPDRFYAVAISEGASVEAFNQYGLLAAIPYTDKYRSVLASQTPPAHAQLGKGVLGLTVSPFSNIELTEFAAQLRAIGINVLEVLPTYHSLSVAANQDAISVLEQHPGVEFIDWIFAEGLPENYTARTLHRTNFLGTTNSNGLNFDGEGIRVALQDDGAIGPHIDQEGRTTHWWFISDGDHGDHVGGTISGAGNLDPRHMGQAPAADLHVYKAWPEYQAYDSLPSHYNNFDVVITSTSYSDGCNAGYTTRARTMDQQSVDFPSVLHVFSAGNSGTSNCGYGAGNTWGNITGGHKMAKNVIAVANLNELGLIANSSSRGPANDGRIKPDLSAKGTNVTSTIAGNQYDTYTGTSMACPGVSGTMAVLYQAYKEQYNELPDGGLMKAIAMNTADDLGEPGPDFIYGWGQINARRAYTTIQDGNFYEGVLAHNAQNTQSIAVNPNTTRLRFMIYWTDPEANVGALTALVNDLDMKVVTPSGDTVLPYLLNHIPNPATLAAPAGNGEDHLNNVEQVELFNPQAGNYQVIVNGHSVPQGPQPYFLVYHLEGKALTLTYPVGGESIIPGSTELIRWDAGDVSQNIDVAFSPNGGVSWTTIANGVAPTGQTYWTVPSTLTSGAVHVRLTQGTTQVVSEAFSVIGVPTNLQVSWACPDSVGLTWNNVPNAVGYKVFKLGEKYMDSIGVSNTNGFVDYGVSPNDPDVWYSVSSIGADGAQGERAIAINKTAGVFNCTLDFDIEAITMLPDASSLFDCHPVERRPGIVVKNNGVSNIIGFDASLYLTSTGLLLSETFVSNLNPGATDTFFFQDSIILDGQGIDPHFVVLNLNSDQNHWNDTSTMVYEIIQSVTALPVFEEDFDLMPICPNTDNCGATTCNILNGWVNEPNGTSDDIDWRLNVGATPTNLSGPSGDFTNNGFGRYLYLEASGDCSFQVAELISPCIDLTASPGSMMSFYYHMYGSDMGELHVDVFDGTSWVNDVMTPLFGNKGDQWRLQEVDLSAFEGKLVNIRFRGITGPSFNSDMAIDGVMIYNPPIAMFEYSLDPNTLTVDFTDQSLYADDMTFDLGDGTVLNAVPASHTYPAIASYVVEQIVSNDFGTDSYAVEINNLNVADLDVDGILVYPNPASDRIVLKLSSILDYDSWSISSIQGATMSLGLILRDSQTIDLSGFSKGVYLLELSGKSPRTVRVVLQ